jgi:hypothetical protein
LRDSQRWIGGGCGVTFASWDPVLRVLVFGAFWGVVATPAFLSRTYRIRRLCVACLFIVNLLFAMSFGVALVREAAREISVSERDGTLTNRSHVVDELRRIVWKGVVLEVSLSVWLAVLACVPIRRAGSAPPVRTTDGEPPGGAAI